MPTERFAFPGHDGTVLAGRLDAPAGPVRATALLAHCFTCGKDVAAARRISARLATSGIAVLRFDFTGLGHSGGEFENTSFSTNVGDLVAAARALDARGMAPGLLVGHSLGGAAMLRAAASIPSARAVATIGAPFEPGRVTRHFEGALARIAADGSGEVVLGGRAIRIGQGFVEDVGGVRLETAIAGLDRALLVMHAPRDETVAIEDATRIFLAARHPKSFVTLDDADHLVSRPEDADYAADVIGAWASRYLALAPPPPPPDAPEGATRASEADPPGYAQDIVAGGGAHHIHADEPVAAGGTGRGMTPYQLLAAALGACTSMTLRMYARRKGWPLDRVAVDVTHDRLHAADAPAPGAGRIDRFRRAIALEGALDDAQRARLLEIAERCPVHRTLESGAAVETALVAGDGDAGA